ncbi:MAG: FAD-binding oxidoreductase [Nitrososphaera sp.]|jgi:FAD/FMN-containing dehydrogenase
MKGVEIKKNLSKIVKCKILSDKYSRNFYSVDSSSYTIKPSAIVFPRNETEIIKIVKFASRHHISITPRGAGTGLVGGALGKGIIMDMSNLNKIKIQNNLVQVQCGVFKGNLDNILKKHHRFLGPNPSIGPYCTIGGMIATNASGRYSLKYGSMIDNLVQVRIVTSNGSVMTLPSDNSEIKKIVKIIPRDIAKKFPQVTKNSCGYRIDRVLSRKDTPKLIAGSEGTLGIIVSAKIKTHRIPKKIILVIISYKTILDAVRDASDLVKTDPASVELIDKHIAKHVNIRIPKKSGCLIFVEFHNDTDLEQIRKKSTGRILQIVTSHEKIKKLWNFRDAALGYSLHSISKNERMPTVIEDAVVPVKRLPMLMKLLNILISKYNLKIITYGHAGNGNLHIRPILRHKDNKIIKEIAQEFFIGVIGIGGSITGEHGDGLARTEFIKLQYDAQTYAIFKRIKKSFDPYNIFNPGKKISQNSTITKNLKI